MLRFLAGPEDELKLRVDAALLLVVVTTLSLGLNQGPLRHHDVTLSDVTRLSGLVAQEGGLQLGEVALLVIDVELLKDETIARAHLRLTERILDFTERLSQRNPKNILIEIKPQQQ